FLPHSRDDPVASKWHVFGFFAFAALAIPSWPGQPLSGLYNRFRRKSTASNFLHRRDRRRANFILMKDRKCVDASRRNDNAKISPSNDIFEGREIPINEGYPVDTIIRQLILSDDTAVRAR